MTTETEQTSEAATATEQQTSTQTTEKEVTLDDVYRDAGLDKVVAQDTQQQTTKQDTTQREPAKVEPSSVPDPYDTENFKAFIARQAAGTTELQKAVSEVAKFLTAQQQAALQAQTKADIEKSVAAIDEVVGIGKPKVIEAYLDGMVREDSRMKALWENRTKNPAAWQNALKVAAKKMSDEFDFKVDPNLQKAQRARKASQEQMATTTDGEESPNASWENLSPDEFDRKWQNLRNSWS